MKNKKKINFPVFNLPSFNFNRNLYNESTYWSNNNNNNKQISTELEIFLLNNGLGKRPSLFLFGLVIWLHLFIIYYIDHLNIASELSITP